MYHLITGHTLFPNRAASAAMTAQVLDVAPNLLKEKPDVPEPLVRVLVKSLAKDPKDRYATPDAFAEELQAVLDGGAIPLAVSFKGKSSLEALKPISKSKLMAIPPKKGTTLKSPGGKEREVLVSEDDLDEEDPPS